jgi:uncharacterized membrane protein
MTASKSSRARAARAQANAARNGTGAATAVKAPAGGTAVKTQAGGTAVKAPAGGTAVKAPARGTAVKAPAGGTAVKAQATATRTMVPFWLQLTTFVLALAGLGVSVYLTIAHFTEKALFACAESGVVNCTKVTTSPQSYVFGIPVAVLGLAFFVAVAALMSPWAWRSPRREVHLIRLASVVAGVGFVLYLLYAELFIIGSICLYCTSVHVITFLLFALTAFAAAAWGINPTRQY